jgi:hypothetical protein
MGKRKKPAPEISIPEPENLQPEEAAALFGSMDAREDPPEEEDKGDPALDVSTREVLDYQPDYPHPLGIYQARPEAVGFGSRKEVHARFRYNIERYYTEGVGWTILEPNMWVVMIDGKEVELTDAVFRSMFIVSE